MSWEFIHGASKSDVVAEIIEQYNPIAHELCGDVLWAVIDTETHGVQLICYPLASRLSDWGFNEIPEEWGPVYVSCPLHLLHMAPVAHRGWRESVRDFHRKNRAI